MTWQLAVVGLIVAAAILYLARAGWRSWKGAKAGCAGGCGCGGTKAREVGGNGKAPLIPSEQLTLRQRDSRRI
jgi:hypothetical protein